MINAIIAIASCLPLIITFVVRTELTRDALVIVEADGKEVYSCHAYGHSFTIAKKIF